tara:strand:+ start:2222 stop:4357 length:2136 start_codon:yes stop_codon:yes gene_type:complete
MYLKNNNIDYKRLIFFASVFFIFSSCSRHKEISFQMPQLFSDGMVIQRDTTISISGRYLPNKNIKVDCSWGFQTNTFSDSLGKWDAKIKTDLSPESQTITLSSSKDIFKINDVLLGEVWIAAGQSNMEMTFDYCCNSTDSSSYEIEKANFPNIRMYNVQKTLSNIPLIDTQGKWIGAVGEDITNFSAVGYFFAKKLHLELHVPIGIIHSSWGGSNIQSWSSASVLQKIEDFSDRLQKLQKDSLKYKKTKDWYSQFTNTPSGSHWWDLFLSEAFPEIKYLDFLLPSWKNLDYLGEDDIKNFSDDSNQWKSLNENSFIKTVYNNVDFSGAILFKNEFELDSLQSESYDLIMKPDKDKPSGLWEYDIYINGEKIGSSLMDLSGADYISKKHDKKYNIDSKILKVGTNILMVRVLGIASLGEIKIKSSNAGISFIKNWKSKILAEEAFQIDNFKYPYTSFYSYNNQNIKFSDIPEKFFLKHNTLSSLYNGMMHPLLNYTIKGFIWYQGESNVGGDGELAYKKIFPLMIKDLRKSFGENMPFFFAQIASYINYGGMLSHFRLIQNSFLRIKNTGMVVTLDIGENLDIHPSNKHDVGSRFALLALNRTYNKDFIDSGPKLEYIEKEGKYFNLYFKNCDSGLMPIKNKNTWFELAGSNKMYFDAEVNVYGRFIQLHSEEVANPEYVRYAWSDTASATLFNNEGLPGPPFSSEYLNLND